MIGRLRTGGYHAAMIMVSLLWLGPIVWVVVMSTRTFDDIAANGVGSLPHSFTLDTYRQAWTDGGQLQALINSMLVTVPAVVLSLGLAAMAAFALSRYFGVPIEAIFSPQPFQPLKSWPKAASGS